MSSQPVIKGLAELQARLKNAAANLPQMVGAELMDGANAIATEAKQRAPGDQGILRNLISVVQQDTTHYSVVSGADYSAFVEFGTGEKVQIPPGLEEYAAQFKGDFASGTYSEGSGLTAKEAIFAWCERKGIDPKLWYPIYVSIMIHGTVPQPFFFPAAEHVTPNIVANVEKVLNEI
jgi:HK97 gp10 family phage protein